MTNRREFLAGVATAGTVAAAGCSSVPFLDDSDGPEAVVEQYLTAAQDADPEAANEVLHPESTLYPVEGDDAESGEEFTLIGVREASTREIVELNADRQGGSDEITEEQIQERIEIQEEGIGEVVDEIGADDYAWVIATIEEDEREETPIPTVRDDGDWYVYF